MLAFKIRDRDDPTYHSVRSNMIAGQFPTRAVVRKGKMFDVGGVQLELFYVDVLAEAIDRTKQTVLAWEKAGWFPRPMFSMSTAPGQPGPRRMYSSVQIMNLHYRMHGHYQCRNNHTFDADNWFKDVRKMFFRKVMVVNPDGTWIQEAFK
jgi:hypothetical protein